jgi:hypothetical protein
MEKLPRQQQSDTLQHPCIGGFEALRITFVGCSTTPRGINLIFFINAVSSGPRKKRERAIFQKKKDCKKTALEIY